MNFGDALKLLHEGHTLRREGWHDPRVQVTLEEKNGMGRIDFQKVVKCQVAHYTHAKLGWHPTPNEILATDWVVVK